jgi:putative inorganic carbon (HCO3(-)) transporter
MLLNRTRNAGYYLISILFICVNFYYLSKGIYYFNLLPLIFLFILAAVFAMDKLFMMIVFFTPLSLSLGDFLNTNTHTDLTFPTEPLLFGILLLFIFKLLIGYRLDSRVMKHPVTLAILFNLGWIAVTFIFSKMPLISFKFLVARLWFVIPSFFVATQIFKNKKNIRRFMWLYIIPLTIVIGYTLYQHSKYNFAEHPANWVVKPFYNDHTSYGAMLAMFIPALTGFLFLKNYPYSYKFAAFLFLLIFIIATILSFTRAAWVSLAVALLFMVILKIKIQPKTLLISLLVALGIFLIFQEQIMSGLEKNNQDSSDNLSEHVQSISNISTDASNKERINRWNCAFRMFKARPILGFGPGTYSFQYAPFQVIKDKTIISTNHGDGGNAHSEYIGPLAESGLLGSLSYIAIVILVISRGMKLYYRLEDKELKLMTMVILLGLVTYFVHGFMNNFLDTDKVSVPFWGFIAMLVAIDVYHSPEPAAE